MLADLTPSKMGDVVMRVWPDDTDTYAVKERKHLLRMGKGLPDAGERGPAK